MKEYITTGTDLVSNRLVESTASLIVMGKNGTWDRLERLFPHFGSSYERGTSSDTLVSWAIELFCCASLTSSYAGHWDWGRDRRNR